MEDVKGNNVKKVFGDKKKKGQGGVVCGFTKIVTPVVLRTPYVTIFVSCCSLSNASKK